MEFCQHEDELGTLLHLQLAYYSKPKVPDFLENTPYGFINSM